jgi:NhaP-type Na+/H+ or K+/H+ antiporter
MSWFGPKGVATMTFSLLVLSQQIRSGPQIFNLAALTVFCSILAHGVTDTAGANWIAGRAQSAELPPAPVQTGKPPASADIRR